MRNPVIAVVALALLAGLAPATGRASLSMYSRDFETYSMPSAGGLMGDGWLVYGNVYTPAMVHIYGYGAYPAPNDGAAFCATVSGQGGTWQAYQQLSVYSDYNNTDAHGAGNIVEALVYQEQTIGPEDAGDAWIFEFQAKLGNLSGASTARAFVKVLDPAAGYATTRHMWVNMTDIPPSWVDGAVQIPIDASLVGQLLQFGFQNYATGFEPSGVYYDNVFFHEDVPTTIGWAALSGPPSHSVTQGNVAGPIYGEVLVEGVTSRLGATQGLVAQLGYGLDGSDPVTESYSWKWEPAEFVMDNGDNDMFFGFVTVTSPAGLFDYCFRYSYRYGPWVYADLDGSANGYSPGQAGSLTVLESAATGLPDSSPTTLRLYPNQPNPFNPLTTIRFDVPTSGSVRLEVYDVAGRLIRTLLDADLPAGGHKTMWDGRNATGQAVASGSYFARLSASGKIETVRMGLVR